jgi:hypothetical protein
MAQRTGDVLARRPTGSWLQRHLAQLAEVLAVMTLVVVVVCAYWAAGGTIGLSEARAHDNVGMQASRALGALVASAGLLCLAGRWGRRRPFWLPAALLWVGSGAMVAFDVLTVVLNRLFMTFGTTLPEAAWAPIDTFLALKAVVGVLTATLGVLVVTADDVKHFEQWGSSADRPMPTRDGPAVITHGSPPD